MRRHRTKIHEGTEPRVLERKGYRPHKEKEASKKGRANKTKKKGARGA